MLATMDTERLSTLTAQYKEIQGAADLMRFLSAKTFAKGNQSVALDVFEQRWPRAPYADTIRLHRKAAVTPGGTTDPAWAGVLVSPPPVDPLTTVVRRDAVLGRLNARKVPFGAKVPAHTSTGTFAWVSPTAPKPVTRIDWASLTLPAGTLAGIVVLTAELVRLQSPGSEAAMQTALTNGIVAAQDRFFLDPAIAEIADVRPASITNGLAPIAGTGNLAADVSTLLAAHFAAWPASTRPTLIMTPASASKLAGTHLNLTVAGGTLNGVPVVPSPAAGAQVVVLDAAALAYADGGLAIDVSTEAAVEMTDTPGAAGAGTVLASFWQLDLAGFRVEEMLWWKALANSVQVLAVA
jgi:hypothetical protein